RPQGAQDCVADQACFLGAGDDLQLDPGFAADALDQGPTVACLACRAGGYGAIDADAVAVHLRTEVGKGLGGTPDGSVVELASSEEVVAKGRGGARCVESLEVGGGGGAGDHQADRIGARVNRSEVGGVSQG